MEVTHKTDFIFQLADKCDIKYKRQSNYKINDDSYSSFCNEYVELAKSRDEKLNKYLTGTTNLFRTFIPWKPYVFNTIFQVQWYYDEIIVFDPIAIHIATAENYPHQQSKLYLADLLNVLYSIKDNLEGGFILFKSYDNFYKKTPVPDEVKALLGRGELLEELATMVQAYKMVADEHDPNFTIRTIFRGQQSFIPVAKVPRMNKEGQPYWHIDLMASKYITLSVEELKTLGQYDTIVKNYQEEFEEETYEIFKNLAVANSINAPALLSTKLEELVIKGANTNSPKAQPNNYFKLILPFVNGIPPERLFDLRNNMPTAFQDFRNFILELVYDLQQENYEDSILQLKLNQKVIPNIRRLDAEIKTSLTKAKITGIGAPLVSGLGSLALWKLGIVNPQISSIIFGGLGISTELKVLADHLGEKYKFTSHPLYFLWKASTI